VTPAPVWASLVIWALFFGLGFAFGVNEGRYRVYEKWYRSLERRRKQP